MEVKMFDSVEDLEKEVIAFRENILASNALVASIEQVSATIREQEKSITSKLENLLDLIESVPTTIKKDNASVLDELIASIEDLKRTNKDAFLTLSESNGKHLDKTISEIVAANTHLIENITVKTEHLLGSIETLPSTIKKDNEMALDALISNIKDLKSANKETINMLSKDSREYLHNAVSEIISENTLLLKNLKSVGELLKSGQKDLAEKNNAFIEKLESTNVEHLFALCEDMKKTMNMKFLIMMIGLALSIFLSVISIVVK